MKTNTPITRAAKKRAGFTLIEVIAVLVLLGILSAIALPKYISLSEKAKERAIDAAITELNGRESLEWSKARLRTGGYSGAVEDDADIRAAVLTPPSNAGSGVSALGPGYTISGTGNSQTISFQDVMATLTRTPSTANSPGTWTRS